MDAAELMQGWMHHNCEDTYPYSVYLLRKISEAWRDFRMSSEPVASFRVISTIDRTSLRACGDLILLRWRMRAMLGHVVLVVVTTWSSTMWWTILMHLRTCSKLLSLRTIAAHVRHCKDINNKNG
jgi:hypothetical protein